MRSMLCTIFDWIIDAEGDNGSPYEEAMDALSSLITKRSRADKSNKGDRYELLFDYLKVIPLLIIW